MVLPRLVRKPSVMSVDPPAPWAPGQITNSGGTRSPARFSPPRGRGGARGDASHRGQLAGPPEGVGVAGAGPGAAVRAWGLCRPNPGGLTWGVPQIAPWGRRLCNRRSQSTSSTNGFYLPGPCGGVALVGGGQSLLVLPTPVLGGLAHCASCFCSCRRFGLKATVSCRCEAPLGGPRWHTKWLGAIRGR